MLASIGLSQAGRPGPALALLRAGRPGPCSSGPNAIPIGGFPPSPSPSCETLHGSAASNPGDESSAGASSAGASSVASSCETLLSSVQWGRRPAGRWPHCRRTIISKLLQKSSAGASSAGASSEPPERHDLLLSRLEEQVYKADFAGVDLRYDDKRMWVQWLFVNQQMWRKKRLLASPEPEDCQEKRWWTKRHCKKRWCKKSWPLQSRIVLRMWCKYFSESKTAKSCPTSNVLPKFLQLPDVEVSSAATDAEEQQEELESHTVLSVFYLFFGTCVSNYTNS